jgi:hypothetical protein
VKLDTGESFRKVGHGKVSTIAIVILLDLLHRMIWLGGYVEKKGPTHRNKRMCLCWDRFGNSQGNSIIPMHVAHSMELVVVDPADTITARV